MNKSQSIVFVVDDDPSFRRSSERLLRMAGHEVESFASAQAFLQRGPPDVAACLVTDLRMPGLNGLDLQIELARAGWQIPIIFITGHGDIATSVHAMKAGASDFLTKPFSESEFLRAVNTALDRDRVRPEHRTGADEMQQRYHSLTPREREVMRHVVSGLLNKQIAARLKIAEKTIKFHRANIMQKMHVGSLAELVQIAVYLGLLVTVSGSC